MFVWRVVWSLPGQGPTMRCSKEQQCSFELVEVLRYSVYPIELSGLRSGEHEDEAVAHPLAELVAAQELRDLLHQPATGDELPGAEQVPNELNECLGSSKTLKWVPQAPGRCRWRGTRAFPGCTSRWPQAPVQRHALSKTKEDRATLQFY